MRRVCDACSVRRVRCDGQSPCAGCGAAGLECTRLRGPKRKPGPKTIRKKTLERLYATQRGAHIVSSPASSWDAHDGTPVVETLAQRLYDEPTVDWTLGCNDSVPVAAPWPYRTDAATLRIYLDIFHHKLYPVWPIVDAPSLVSRLEAFEVQSDAYMLALSVCAATILQLQLAVPGSTGLLSEPQCALEEIENLRRTTEYRQHCTLESLSVSFFLHVAYLHVGARTTSTLLLREAISTAHILGLHSPAHYIDLSPDAVQDHLRKWWLLFVTERAHANQYDLPCIATIDPSFPTLSDAGQPFKLTAFLFLCRMFAHYAEENSRQDHTSQSLIATHDGLRDVSVTTSHCNLLQRADLVVTQQWMSLMLWKTAMQHVEMDADPHGTVKSMFFPLQVARDLMHSMSEFTIDTLEAHGPGMELKLFAIATSVADVMMLPLRSSALTNFGSQDSLRVLAGVLGRFRGGNSYLMPILQARLTGIGLDVPGVPRVIDVSHEEDGEEPYWSSPRSTKGSSSTGERTIEFSNVVNQPDQSHDGYFTGLSYDADFEIWS